MSIVIVHLYPNVNVNLYRNDTCIIFELHTPYLLILTELKRTASEF